MMIVALDLEKENVRLLNLLNAEGSYWKKALYLRWQEKYSSFSEVLDLRTKIPVLT